MSGSVVGICYRPLDQEAEIDEDFRQLEGVSCLHILVLIGTSTTLIPAEGTTQWGISNPGCFWSTLMTTS